jgi:REP element-mobilizing transposase RayT
MNPLVCYQFPQPRSGPRIKPWAPAHGKQSIPRTSPAGAKEKSAGVSGTYTNLLYHIVFSTKNRAPLITKTLQTDLHAYLGGIVREHEGIALSIGGMPDHVHILAKLKPKLAVSDVVRDVKAGSSKWIYETSRIRRKFGWQNGFSAFSVSFSQVPRVRRYIETQEEHHHGTDFKVELLTMLRKNHVEFDEATLWD